MVRAERFAAATFKELKTTAQECINRLRANDTARVRGKLMEFLWDS